jgi:hypothetical protein
MPDSRPDTVVLVPVPVEFMLPGKRVSVQVPGAGNPFSTTVPPGTWQVGWVIAPGTGAAGVRGC